MKNRNYTQNECVLGVTTSQLDSLAAETAAYMSQMHPDFSILAARITISNLHKGTSESFRFKTTLETSHESKLHSKRVKNQNYTRNESKIKAIRKTSEDQELHS